MEKNNYITPLDTSSINSPHRVARILGDLINALDSLDHHRIDGDIISDVNEFRADITRKLREAGWQVRADGLVWVVLPPKE